MFRPPRSIRRLDRSLSIAATTSGPQWVHAVLARLSVAANGGVLWFAVAGILAASGRRGRRAALRGLLSLGAGSAMSNGLKPGFRRVRPPIQPDAASFIDRPRSSSFPSGHAGSACAFATGAIVEIPALAVPLGALVGAVAYSRVSTGVHYPVDVVAGSAIGIAAGLMSTKAWPLTDDAPASAIPARPRDVGVVDGGGAGLTVVVNGGGASTHDDIIAAIRARLPECHIVEVGSTDDFGDVFDRAARSASALGVIGGDGTVSTAASFALAHDLPLAVFPGGTLNHFARDLGITDVHDTIDAIAASHAVQVDVGLIDDRVFVNTASFGTYPALVAAREEREHTIGKWPAMLLALGKMLRSTEPTVVELDGRRRSLWMIFIGNCAYDPPGFAPASRDRLDDGHLDVRLVDATVPAARVRLALAVALGRLGLSPVYERELVASLHVELVSSTELAADGERFSGRSGFDVVKAPRRLAVYAPPAGAGVRG